MFDSSLTSRMKWYSKIFFRIFNALLALVLKYLLIYLRLFSRILSGIFSIQYARPSLHIFQEALDLISACLINHPRSPSNLLGYSLEHSLAYVHIMWNVALGWQKSLRSRISPVCTLSQNGYGDDLVLYFDVCFKRKRLCWARQARCFLTWAPMV